MCICVCVCIKLIHFAVHLKLTNTILQINYAPIKIKKLGGEQDGGGVGGCGVHLHGYIRNIPSDTEVHTEHQLRVDRSA